MSRHPANALFHALKKIADEQERIEAEEIEWHRQMQERVGRKMLERSRNCYIEGSEHDGDGGREHSDYMDDNRGRG